MSRNLALITNKTYLTLAAACLCVLLITQIAHGQLDLSFGTNGIVTANPGSSAGPLASFILPDGKIFVVTRTGCCGSSGNGTHFFRFNSDGTPDTTYSPTGYKQASIPFTIQGRPYAAARQPDGKIVIVGRHDSASGFVVRFNEDASIDSSFAGSGYYHLNIRSAADDELLSVLVQPDNKILVAGYVDISPSNRLIIARFLPNGTLDSSLGSGGVATHQDVIISDNIGDQFIYLNSTGKILIANPRENAGGKIRRFNTDGSVDTTFTAVPCVFVSGFIRTVSFIQPDDKILVSGIASRSETLLRTHDDVIVYRYNADGTPDTGFGAGGSVSIDISSYLNDEPLGFQVTPDGQIIVVIETDLIVNRTGMAGTILSYAKLSANGTIVGKYLATNEDNSLTEPSFTHLLQDGKVLTVFRRSGGMLLARLTDVPMRTYIIQGIPFNYPGGSNLPAKPSVFRPADGTFRSYPFQTAVFGAENDIPVEGDFVGNLYSDFAFFRPSTGTWYISHNDWDGPITSFSTVRWGLAGDIPVAGDYDGDGKSDIAVFRPSDGVWYIRHSADESLRYVKWGIAEDKPTVGDFDGDGRYDIAVFRPSNGTWYIIRSSDGGFIFTRFGLEGDIPVQEDYDNDRKFDIAVYRPSSGVWYRLNSSDGSFFAHQWGLPGDIPVPAEYDGDGKVNIAVWRPSNGTWYIVNPDHASMHHYTHGASTDIPLPRRY